MKIGNVAIEPVTKKQGILEVARRYDGSYIGIPLMTASGRTQKPLLCIAAGVHGDEYVGGEAVRRFIAAIDSRKLRGTVIGVPALNMPAFEMGTRVGPFDSLDLNRVFPGRAEGYTTELIAHAFFNEVVSKCDYCIDIHSPGTFFKATPSVNYEEAEGEQGVKTMKLAESVGVELLWHYERPGSLAGEAMRKGIPSVVLDYIGEDSRVTEEDVKFAVKCLNNIAIHLKMIDGKLDLPKHLTYLLGRNVSDNQMYSRCGGFFSRNVEPGQRVNKGDLLGTIYDVFGKAIEKVLCPHDNAIVVAIRSYPSVKPGGWCAFVPRIVTIK